ncbi:phosphoenolpyruvate carboxylase [Erythrobacter crassostreae]|uniref:Phosphoenolpyruvate carboxylase n=1 Tax=Erythrobacter crassostreae TaxID=2828328 RepID=A0A9X1F5E9_9SPHN|nr:phosphoenolpyruvate carboxylase [Erythrobacter crassostrea]MBV7259145.1 phosphoenolpyruvate carboxylase [Erythrobacter crassostrea]
MTLPLKSTADLSARLQELHARTRETPLFNPVFQLGLDLSRALEDGSTDLDTLESLVEELECAGLEARANRLQRLVAPVTPEANHSALGAALGATKDFDAFRAQWESPRLHAVFTAHPTFLMTPGQSAAVAEAASANTPITRDVCAADADRPAITLEYEHGEVNKALANAQDARAQIVRETLSHAAKTWPEKWLDLAPLPFRFASWVGYDMDGRTDIKWYTSIRFRLSEKAERLRRFANDLEAIQSDHELIDTLRLGADHAARSAEDFGEDLSEPEALSQAANRLTYDHPDKLTSLVAIIDQLESEARGAGNADLAIALKTLASCMRADGLGMGHVHFRVNAKQLHNAIRSHMHETPELDLASKGAVATLRRMLSGRKPMRTNFASLAIESSTAIRQFLAMAQILEHIDADTPIRMLIAECEQPSTVLAALYFARAFGIEDKVDVSPLFETESALEHGGRFLDSLCAEKQYRDYVQLRGRACIQTGFSDAGRFVGQIPASLAIERLQGRFAQAMAKSGLTDVAALIFNTHGESMGRGAHPSGFEERLTWPMSGWARHRFASSGIKLEPEVSFQGGDGYMFFSRPELALATLSRIICAPVDDSEAANDPFYSRTDISLDFYRAVRAHQRQHLRSSTYSRAVTAFGLGLLNSTGSRVSRRQSDISADRDMNLRQIRAIPHNSILQQLGYPVNVISGIGSAADGNFEELASLIEASPRGQQLISLARASNSLASIKTVAAYGELFNSAYWASRPYRGTEQHLSGACETLAEFLTKDDRTGVYRRLASRLRVDALKLYRLFDLLPAENRDTNRENTRRMIGAAQSVRLALMQHIFLKAVSVPVFSRANDISREDVLEMVFSLRIEDALAQMRRAFPTHFPETGDFAMDAQADYPDSSSEGYAQIGRDFIDPMERAYSLMLRLSISIANQFGAHG